jgi:hypothetical protein
MIKVENCPACGRMILSMAVANLAVRVDPSMLEADDAVRLLLDGRALWRVMHLGGRPYRLTGASPAVLGALRGEPGERPHVVVEHRCSVTAQAALSRPRTPTPGPSVQPTPQRPSAGQQTPSSGLQTAPSSAPSAEPHRSSPTCDACRKPCDVPGSYASIEIGRLTVWAQHVLGPCAEQQA